MPAEEVVLYSSKDEEQTEVDNDSEWSLPLINARPVAVPSFFWSSETVSDFLVGE